MNKSILLLAIVTLAFVSPSYGDFTDISGKILPLNSTEKARNYTVELLPKSNASFALFTGIQIAMNQSMQGNTSATNSSTPSSNSTTSSSDVLLFSVETNSTNLIKLAYFKTMQALSNNSANSSSTNSSATNSSSVQLPDFSSLVKYLYIVEFNNTNAVPGLQIGEDNITSNYNLSHPQLKWNLTLNQTQASDINGTSYTFYTLLAETSDKVYALRLLIGGRAANVSGFDVKPNEVKYDIRIRWFNNPEHVAAPWTLGPSNTSANAQLAILSAFAASQGTLSKNNTVGDAHNSAEVSFKGPQYESFFRWAAQAKILGSGVFPQNTSANTTNTGSNSTSSNSTANNSTSSGSAQMSVITVSEIAAANATNLATLLPINGTLNMSIPANWTTYLVFHAFDAMRPQEILLDPQFGLRLGTPQTARGKRAFLSWFY